MTSAGGLLVLDKPRGITTMHLCRMVRRHLIAGGATRNIKVGHAGTLDPLASGVVIVLVGSATRLCAEIMDRPKRYEAHIDLAHISTTDDLEGQVAKVPVAAPPSRADVEAACRSFVGTITQRPPPHSAVWVGGVRSYHLARAGRPPDLPPRQVVIYAIEVLGYEWPLLRLDLRCGKGTYIRSLARDLGRRLGTGGMLASLRRTEVGEFTVTKAISPADLPERLALSDLLTVPPRVG